MRPVPAGWSLPHNANGRVRRPDCAPAASVATPVRIGEGVAGAFVLAICIWIELCAVTGLADHRSLCQYRCCVDARSENGCSKELEGRHALFSFSRHAPPSLGNTEADRFFFKIAEPLSTTHHGYGLPVPIEVRPHVGTALAGSTGRLCIRSGNQPSKALAPSTSERTYRQETYCSAAGRTIHNGRA